MTQPAHLTPGLAPLHDAPYKVAPVPLPDWGGGISKVRRVKRRHRYTAKKAHAHKRPLHRQRRRF